MKNCSAYFLSATRGSFQKNYYSNVLCLIALLVFFISTVELWAADAVFTWTANTEANLAGYRVHYGTTTGTYGQFVEVPKTETSVTISSLTEGETYYFAATGYDTDNFESEYSDEVVWTAASTGNTIPIAFDNAITTTEGVSVSGRLIGTDANNDPLHFSIAANGSLGSVVITNAAVGNFTYIPNDQASGADSFTFRVYDGIEYSNTATVSVTIDPQFINTSPVANNGSITTTEGTVVTGTLSGSDVNSGDTLLYSIVSNGTLGNTEISDSSTGAFSYTPNAQTSGTDSFTFQVYDGIEYSNTATVLVTIEPQFINTSPVANNGSITTTEGTVVTGTLSGSDVNSGDTLLYSVVSNGTLGNAEISNSSTGAFSYTPNAQTSGTDSFTFQVYDGTDYSNIASITVTILEAGNAQAVFTWTANTELNLAGYRVHHGTSSRAYTQVTEIPKTETSVTITGLTEGQTYYFAATGFDTDNFESDYSTEVVWTAAQITGTSPVAESGILETTEGASASGTLVATDADGDALTYSIGTNGSLGSVVITNASIGDYTYIPNTGATGTDTFTFVASDGTLSSNEAVVTVSISVVAVPPVAVIQSQEIVGSPYAMRFDATGSTDQDGTIISYLWNLGDGSIGTDPVMDHIYSVAGEYSVSLTVTDDSGAESLDVVTVTIVGEVLNAAPVAQFSSVPSVDNSALINFDATTSFDPDGVIASYTWNFGDGGTATGAITSHEYEISGLYSVTLTVMDNDGETSKFVVEVDVVVPERFFMESGEVIVTAGWQWVAFSEPIENPVVIAKPVSNNDSNPVVVRINDVQATGFNIGLQHWGYLDQEHGAEKVGFIAMSAGNIELENGARIEAGTFVTNQAETFEQKLFDQPFQVVPVVTASITTYNEDEAVTGRIRNVATSGFDYRMQEQASNDPVHLAETISYIAWEPSSGMLGDLAYEVKMTGLEVTHEWTAVPFSTVFGLTPIIAADMQTAVDVDPANLRYQGISTTGVQLSVVEEQSFDEDMTHGAEQAGLIILGILDRAPDGLTADLDLDNSVDGLDLILFVDNPSSVNLEEVAAQYGLMH